MKFVVEGYWHEDDDDWRDPSPNDREQMLNFPRDQIVGLLPVDHYIHHGVGDVYHRLLMKV